MPKNPKAGRLKLLQFPEKTSISSSKTWPTSTETMENSGTRSSNSSATSTTSEQPETWRPQSDHMVVTAEQVPQFMVETSKLFQMALNSEIETLVLVGMEHAESDPALGQEIEAQTALLTVAKIVARQMQEKYAAILHQSQPQLWLPDTSLSTPGRGRNSDA